jgi:hypothetical protein
MQEQAKRERDSVPTQLHMHASGVAASSSPDNRRTENGDQRGGEWEPQISFEIFSRCPKFTAKNTTQRTFLNLKYPSQLVTRVPR